MASRLLFYRQRPKAEYEETILSLMDNHLFATGF